MPLYNCEKYIGASIASVINQSYQDWELLIVDGFSTDKGPSICENYKSKDSRIKFFQMPNEGVSMARNIAIKEAKGEYLCFLDADDFLKENFLENCALKIHEKNPDCMISEFEILKECKQSNDIPIEKLKPKFFDEFARKDFFKYIHKNLLIYTVWRLAIKKNVVIRNNILFQPGIVHEDEDWVVKVLLASRTFLVDNSRNYTYRIRENSITTNKTIYNYESYLKVAQNLVEENKRRTENFEKTFLLGRISIMLVMANMGFLSLVQKDTEMPFCFDWSAESFSIKEKKKSNSEGRE